MPKYMVVVLIDGEPVAKFFTDFDAAHQCAMDAESGLGAEVEFYERNDDSYQKVY